MTMLKRFNAQSCWIVTAMLVLAISSRAINTIALFFMKPDQEPYWLLWTAVFAFAGSFAYLVIRVFITRRADLPAGGAITVHVHHHHHKDPL